MLDTAYEYLRKDFLHYADIIDPLNRGVAELLYAGSDGVLIYNKPGYCYSMIAESHDTFLKMCALMEKPEMVSIHQYEFVDELMQRFSFTKKMDTRSVVFLSKVPVRIAPPRGISFKRLEMTNLPFVMETYHNAPNEEYMVSRIEEGMIGAFDGERPVGLIGTHGEGTMGMLEIIPEYRRRGIAMALENEMINLLLEQGRLPYGGVVLGNTASEELQAKLGGTMSDKPLIWVW